MTTLMKVTFLQVVFIIAITQINGVKAFTPSRATLSTFTNNNSKVQNSQWTLSSSTAEEQTTSGEAVELASVSPSWEELEKSLPENEEEPKVTLYRDTNG